MQSNILIQAEGLKKYFGGVRAVDGISFDIYNGELFGFLGPNGAGKTTTINMLTGLAKADDGKIIIDGIDCSKKTKKAQHLIGVVPDESNLYPELTGYDNLCFCASLYGVKKSERENRAKKLLSEFGLEEAGWRKFGGYSKGMKRKLTIAAGIIHEPKILFLDEPTTGIDIASARQIRALVEKLNKEGTTIFLTTHYIEEAERLCQRIAFIVSGKITKIDTMDSLLQPLMEKNVSLLKLSDTTEKFLSEIRSAYPNDTVDIVSNGQIKIESKQEISLNKVLRIIEDNHLSLYEAKKVRPSLEDVFVDITGIEAELLRKEKGGKK